MARICTFFICVSACCLSALAAAPPSDTLLPATTKGYLSVPDVAQLQDRWNETQIGHMANDPLMRPFVDDLREQIKRKMSTTRVRLGLTLDDLEGIYGGELSLAMLQPENDASRHATVVLVDVTGHDDQVQAMLKKVDATLIEQKAVRRTEKLGGVEVTIFTMPKKREDAPTVEAFYVVRHNMLVVCDDQGICEQILARLEGEQGETLADLPAYQQTMERVARDSGDMQPQIRWFVDPFGYAEAVRAAAGGRQRKGPDLIKILPHQGFDAIRGVGGYVFLATGEQEMMHRTMIYAPGFPTEGDGAQEARFTQAARMLEFPNTDTLAPQDFVSRDLGSYFTFNWKMKEAFEYSKTLVNELLGGGKDDDLMEEIIVGLAKDKDGPQVDLRTDLVAHFAERASMITDCRRPITTESERLMFAVELDDAEAVRATIAKAFNADPDAQKREFEGHVIWEIIKDDAPAEVEELQIEGGLDVFDPFDEQEPVVADEEEEAKILPNSAITVANGQLIVASHVDFIVEMLQRPLGTELLTDAADYQQVSDALSKIGAGTASFRFFARTDETYRPTYELIRQGKMPESKTLFGKLLNSLLGPDEKGILREQQIDGSKMPEFDAVRRYLGPAGLFVQTEENGWYMAGCLLSKEMR